METILLDSVTFDKKKIIEYYYILFVEEAGWQGMQQV